MKRNADTVNVHCPTCHTIRKEDRALWESMEGHAYTARCSSCLWVASRKFDDYMAGLAGDGARIHTR